MKSDFTFSSHIVKKHSLSHSLLSALIGGDTKIGWIEIAAKVISEIQIIALILNIPFDFLSKSAESDMLGDFFESITNYIALKDVVSFTENSVVTSIVLGVIFAYMLGLLVYIIAFVVGHYLGTLLSVSKLRIWINMSVVHFTVLFLYIHNISLGLIKASNDSNVYVFGSRESSIFIAVGIIILILNILFALLSSRFVHEPIKSSYIAAIRTTVPDLLSVLYKAGSTAIRIFVTNLDAQKWLRIIFVSIIMSIKLYTYLKRVPYYYFQAMRLFQVFAFIQFALAALGVIILLVNEGMDISSTAFVYIALVVSAFFAKISDVVLHMMISKYGMKSIEELKTKDEFYKKLFAVDFILEQGSISSTMEKKSRENFTEFLYYGVIKAHKNKCKKLVCGCNLILEKEIMSEFLPLKEDQRKIMRDFKFELIQDLYKGFKHPEVQVTLANFLFENKSHFYAAAISIIHSLDLKKTPFELRVISSKLLEKIENRVLTNYDSEIDIQEIVDYQRLSFDLRQIVNKNLTKFLKFWEIYKGAEPNISDLFKMSVELNQEAEQVAQIWSKIISKYSKLSYQDHLLYGLYQSLVRSAPHTAEKALHKYFSLSAIYSTQKNRNPLITPTNVFEPQNIITYIVMKKEAIGQVLFVTPNIENTLQYSTNDIIGKNINMIMPEFYKERHDKILLAHINKSRTMIMNRNRAVYAKKKNGFITPVNLFVSIFPYFQKQLIYIGLLRPMQTFDEFILVLPNGIIDSFSENVAKLLNLDPERVRQYSLKNICKEISKYQKAFEYLIDGDREKLRTIAYSRKSHNNTTNTGGTTSGPKHQQGGSDNSFVQQRTSQTSKGQTNFQSITTDQRLFDRDSTNKSDLFKEEEFDQWTRLYELFTSTGVPVFFYRYVEGGKQKTTKAPIEFNTIMIEETAYNSKLMVLRLQSVSTEIAQKEEFEDEDFDQEDANANQPPEGQGEATPVKNTQVKELNSGLKESTPRRQTVEDSKFQTLNTQQYETEEAELISGKKKWNLLREKTLPFSLRDHMPLASGEEDCDFRTIPDDDELISMNTVSALRNPLMTKMISSQNIGQMTSTTKRELLKEEAPLELVTEDRHQEDNNDMEVTQIRGVSPFKRQDTAAAEEVEEIVQSILKRKVSAKKSMVNSDESSHHRTAGKFSDDDESFDEEGAHQDSEKKQKLRRFFQTHKLLALDAGAGIEGAGGDRSSTRSSTRSSRISSKVERAIYINTIDASIKILNYLVALFCFVTIVLIIFYLLTTNTNIDRVKNNVSIQKFSTQRLYQIVEINRMARIINIIERGLSDPARITSDDTLSNLQSLEETSTDLSNSNNEIRRSISKIDQSEQPRFYKEILIYERGDNTKTKQLNSLDACTEIVNSGLRLNDMIPSKPAFDDPDLVFILSNTLNDLVVSNEEIANILLDDNRISLQKVETTIIILLIATVAISFGIITFVGRSEKKFVKRKINFLDSFLRIKDYEIASTLAVVNNFNNALKENDREEKFLQKVVIDKIRVEEFKKNDGKKEHRSFKAKSANLKGMNTSIFVNLGLVTAFVIFFILIFGILLAVLLNFQSSISKLMLRVINTNINLFQFGLVFTSLFEYVSENGATTIRDEPIGDEWERTYRVLTGSNDFFNSFMDQDENFNNQMAFLLNSDLCSSYFTDRPCATELSGVGTRGILGINAFILKNLRGIKDYYDDTDRSPAAKEVTLGMQDMLDAEIAYTIYTSRSYTELDLILTNQFYLESDKLLKSSLIIGIVSIVVLLVLTKVVWLQAIKRMEDERKNFRNIMRVIPINIIMSNRYLKNYLMRNSQKMLDSIKNRI